MTTALVRGVTLTAGSRDSIADELERWIAERRREFVCCAPVHLVETARRNARVATALRQAGMVLPDGQPVAWAMRAGAGVAPARIAGSDVFAALCQRSERARYRHFFVGGTPTTLA